jgi:flavorubredoxin
MHAGSKKMFEPMRNGGAAIIDPSKLRWIGFSYFESDECGALDEWLRVAPHDAGCLQSCRPW